MGASRWLALSEIGKKCVRMCKLKFGQGLLTKNHFNPEFQERLVRELYCVEDIFS
jgi:hypothetical protein